VEKPRAFVPFGGNLDVEPLTPERQAFLVDRLNVLGSEAT